MPRSFSPAVCHINLSALVHNFQRLGAPEKLMPVIKSDAYGHGLENIAQTLAKAGAKRFAVGTAREGQALRENGIEQEIVLLLGCLDKEDWQLACRHRLTPLVGTFRDLDLAALAQREYGQDQLQMAIKCDTGMTRLGFSIENLAQLREKLLKAGPVKPVLLMSHLACADMPEAQDYTSEQIESFNYFHNALKDMYPEIKRSLGNSAATLGLPQAHYEIARPGLALYGGNPFHGTPAASNGSGLEWVMSLSAPVLHIREVAKGQAISYGRTFIAPRAMRIAVVGAGYANGVCRGLSNKTSFLVNGERARQVGRICMGMLMVDITDIDGVKTGDQVWLLGGRAENGKCGPDAQELANILGTIPYEIMCLAGSLNPRVYLP